MTHIIHEKVRELEIQLQELNDKKAVLQEELKNTYAELKKSTSPTIPKVHNLFSPEEKIKIFMNLVFSSLALFFC